MGVPLVRGLGPRLPLRGARARRPGGRDFEFLARVFHKHHFEQDGRPTLISLVDEPKLRQVLARMLDEAEFLSPFGLRSLSRHHREHPLAIVLDGREARLDYEPGESATGLFGGNSNWRGPIWFPLNFLALESLRHLHSSLGDGVSVELPTGSGVRTNVPEVSHAPAPA